MTPLINISPSSALIFSEVVGFTYEYLSEPFQKGFCSINNCIFAFVKSVSSSIYKVIRPVLNFFFYHKISQVQKSTKKHNQYIGFFQDKILSTLNTLVFVQDKILYQMSP